MAGEDNLSPLERIKKRLYTPGAVPPPAPPPIAPAKADLHAPTTWSDEPAPAPTKPKISPAVWFLIGAVAFFIVAGVAAAAFIYFGTRAVSVERVSITMSGPTSIASGDTVPLVITIENKNAVEIKSTLLSVEFPPGTKSADEPGEDLPRYSDTVGPIAAGESVTRTVRAVVTGGANQTITIPVAFEYRTDGSDASFIKKEEYALTITSSPVGVSIETLSQTPSGQVLTLKVTVRANGPGAVEDIVLLPTYPFGFSLQTSNPAAGADGLIPIGTLAAGETRTVTITGTLSGQESDERVFKFAAGAAKGDGSKALAVEYLEQEATVRITKPFLAVSVKINGSEQDTVVANAGSTLSGSLTWMNTIQNTITDGQILIKVSGDALDLKQVTTGGAFYRSSDQTIVVNKETAASLKEVKPGEGGGASFSLPMKTGAAMDALRQPTITLSVSVVGKRIGESGVPQTVSSTLTRTVKVATDLTLTSRIVRTVGPFTNSGPWPPKPDVPTTYTIMLSAQNTVNSVGGTRVSMNLPSYVTFTGKTQPSDGSVSYNESTREVVWNIGDLPAGAQKTAAFQISFLPSIAQQGTSPVLVYPQSITGTDRFTETEVGGSAPELDTEATTDPGYSTQFGNVTSS